MHTQTMTRSSPRQPAGHVPHPVPEIHSHTLGTSIDLVGASMPFARNAEIYGENEPAEYLYKVVNGSVRTYKVLNDGRRQIGAFYLPGDVFGLEVGEVHTFSAEAIVNSKDSGHQAQHPGQPGGARQRNCPQALDHDGR